MIRSFFAILSGVAITFALFVFMAYLISGGAKRNVENSERIVIDIVGAPPESKVDTRRRVPPPPPPPPKQPPKPQQVEPEPQQNAVDALSFNIPTVDVGGGKSLGMDAPTIGAEEGDATPIVRIEPKYPVQAARDGKEGFVQLSFTITETGEVDDISVIKAEPNRIFNREAMRALRKWKYKPKIVDGKAVRQPGMSVELVFKLNK